MKSTNLTEQGIDLRDQRCLDKLDDARGRVAERREAAGTEPWQSNSRRVLLLATVVVVAIGTVVLMMADTHEPIAREAPGVAAVTVPPEPPTERTKPPIDEVAATAPAPAPTPPIEPVSAVKIVEMKFCKSIVKRVCVDELQNYAPEDGATYVWTEVRATSVPLVLRHVYYQDEQKLADVPLEILHFRTRTWSKLHRRPGSSGSLRIDIVDPSGSVLISKNLALEGPRTLE